MLSAGCVAQSPAPRAHSERRQASAVFQAKLEAVEACLSRNQTLIVIVMFVLVAVVLFLSMLVLVTMLGRVLARKVRMLFHPFRS